MPPDLVTVLMIAPVNPPYSAGAPRPPIWISSIRFWLKKVQAEPPSGSRVSTPSSSSALPIAALAAVAGTAVHAGSGIQQAGRGRRIERRHLQHVLRHRRIGRGALDVNRRRGATDVHRFAERRDLHREVNHPGLAQSDRHLEGLTREGRAEFGLQGIGAGLHRKETELPLLVGRRGLGALRAGQRGCRAWKNGALLVGDGAFDGAHGGLRVRRGRHEHGGQHERVETSNEFDHAHLTSSPET